MKISVINGSPKASGISSLIINQMEKLLDKSLKTYHAIKVAHMDTSSEIIADILDTDILLIVFPLFVDSLPSPLIELLTKLESTAHQNVTIPRIYTIVNGALDVEQTALALEMIEHFTCRAGLSWGYGIGIGEGSLLYNAGEEWGNSLASDVYHALCDMVVAINQNQSRSNVYVSPKFPRFLYKAIANISFKIEAKRGGVDDIWKRPYINQDHSLRK